MKNYLMGLSDQLVLDDFSILGDTIHVYSHLQSDSNKKQHSKQVRIVKDIPYNNYKVVHSITVNRYFIGKGRKTTMERLDFVSATRRRTKRLDDLLAVLQKETSFIGLERILNKSMVSISDSTLLRLVKKNNNI